MITAMKELIEKLKRNIEEMPNEVNSFTQGYKAGLNFVIECATTSLEKEKKQIINGHWTGWSDAYDYLKEDNNDRARQAEEYYEETYQDN